MNSLVATLIIMTKLVAFCYKKSPSSRYDGTGYQSWQLKTAVDTFSISHT